MEKPTKIRQLITVENRISLYQTAMNNSGRNFAGKSVKVKKMVVFASDLYKAAIKEIESIGSLSVAQMGLQMEMAFKKKTSKKKKIKKAELGKLMCKIKNKKNGKIKAKKIKVKKGKGKK